MPQTQAKYGWTNSAAMTRMTLFLMSSSRLAMSSLGWTAAIWVWTLALVDQSGFDSFDGGDFVVVLGGGDVAVGEREGVHGDGEEEVEDDDFDEDGIDGFFRGFDDGRDHDAGHVGDGFDAGESEDDFDEVVPFDQRTPGTLEGDTMLCQPVER